MAAVEKGTQQACWGPEGNEDDPKVPELLFDWSLPQLPEREACPVCSLLLLSDRTVPSDSTAGICPPNLRASRQQLPAFHLHCHCISPDTTFLTETPDRLNKLVSLPLVLPHPNLLYSLFSSPRTDSLTLIKSLQGLPTAVIKQKNKLL